MIEYKGEAYKTNDDPTEKNNIGLREEEMSGGRLLFLRPSSRTAKGAT